MALYYCEYNFFIPFILAFTQSLVVFFRLSFSNTRFLLKNDVRNVLKQKHQSNRSGYLIRLNKTILALCLVSIFNFKGYSSLFWNEHFLINNTTLFCILLLFTVNILFLDLAAASQNKKIVYYFDYFFSLLLIGLFMPLLFITNNLFSFFIILELNACAVFYKFVMSMLKYNNKKIQPNKFNTQLPHGYLGMLFFNYWASFFSSVLIIYIIVYFYLMYGTTDWSLVSLIFSANNELQYLSNSTTSIFLSFIFLNAFFIKLGLTPMHLYKIEVYKGLPFLTLFFYTTYYFFAYFMYFFLLVVLYVPFMVLSAWWYIFFFVTFGFAYIISLLFDINFVKAFFAYSTVVNSLSFFIMILFAVCP